MRGQVTHFQCWWTTELWPRATGQSVTAQYRILAKHNLLQTVEEWKPSVRSVAHFYSLFSSSTSIELYRSEQTSAHSIKWAGNPQVSSPTLSHSHAAVSPQTEFSSLLTAWKVSIFFSTQQHLNKNNHDGSVGIVTRLQTELTRTSATNSEQR
jgi:hypothetical protein